MKKSIFIAFAAALMLTGCNSEKEKTAEKEKTPTEAVTTVSTESTETASTSRRHTAVPR